MGANSLPVTKVTSDRKAASKNKNNSPIEVKDTATTEIKISPLVPTRTEDLKGVVKIVV